MATVNLGAIKFKWKGTYNALTAYTIDDVVSYNGSSYICISNSTGNLPTNATYFEQMSSAGTNGTDGTDLTTTLTTQGDILYRDGSGLARLPAGSANQVLQSGGAGANPSWGTVSSDYVKLAETEITGTTGSVTYNTIFTNSNDYKTYKIFFSDIRPDTGGSEYYFRFIRSGTAVSTSNYRWVVDVAYHNGSTGGASTSTGYNTNFSRMFAQDVANGANTGISGEWTCALPNKSATSATTSSAIFWHSSHGHFGNGADVRAGSAGGYLSDGGGTVNGIFMYPSSGNWVGGTITIYGIK